MSNEFPSIESIADSFASRVSPLSRGKLFPAETFEHEMFPWVAGIYQKVKKELKGDLVFLCRDRRESEFYDDLFYMVFGELPGNIPRPSSHYQDGRSISFYSEQVMTVVNELTQNNTLPPYLLLQSSRRITNYLRGFFHNGAVVSYNSQTVKTTGTRKKLPLIMLNLFTGRIELGAEISDILKKLGVASHQYTNRIIISAKNSVQKILELKLLDEKSKSKLEDLLEEMKAYWEINAIAKRKALVNLD